MAKMSEKQSAEFARMFARHLRDRQNFSFAGVDVDFVVVNNTVIEIVFSRNGYSRKIEDPFAGDWQTSDLVDLATRNLRRVYEAAGDATAKPVAGSSWHPKPAPPVPPEQAEAKELERKAQAAREQQRAQAETEAQQAVRAAATELDAEFDKILEQQAETDESSHADTRQTRRVSAQDWLAGDLLCSTLCDVLGGDAVTVVELLSRGHAGDPEQTREACYKLLTGALDDDPTLGEIAELLERGIVNAEAVNPAVNASLRVVRSDAVRRLRNTLLEVVASMSSISAAAQRYEAERIADAVLQDIGLIRGLALLASMRGIKELIEVERIGESRLLATYGNEQ